MYPETHMVYSKVIQFSCHATVNITNVIHKNTVSHLWCWASTAELGVPSPVSVEWYSGTSSRKTKMMQSASSVDLSGSQHEHAVLQPFMCSCPYTCMDTTSRWSQLRGVTCLAWSRALWALSCSYQIEWRRKLRAAAHTERVRQRQARARSKNLEVFTHPATAVYMHPE